MKNRQQQEGGFTLLELLMVVIIIAILAAIALPQYLRAAERSRAAEALSLVGAIRSAQLRFKAQDPNNAYATDNCTLDIDLPGCPTGVTTTSWSITVAAAPPVVTATRLGGGIGAGKTVEINLDTGATCSTDPALYGLAPSPC